jgi:Cys-rich peptide (Clo7bot family)
MMKFIVNPKSNTIESYCYGCGKQCNNDCNNQCNRNS